MQHSDDTEHSHAYRQPDVWFQLLEQDIRGYLAQDVRNVEDDKGGAILVPDELQVVVESEQDRIRNVHAGKSLRLTPSLHQISNIPV